MDTLKVKIEKIKNIETASFEIPIESGVYSLVGTNGCGKSTVLLSVGRHQKSLHWHPGDNHNSNHNTNNYFTLDRIM